MDRVAIFDVDGTLVDSVDLHAEAWQEAFREFGHEIPLAEIRAQIGKGGDQLMPVFVPKEELERRGQEIEEYRGKLFRREYLPRVKAFPKVRELFLRLRADGRRIALASSAAREELEVYERIANIADLVEHATSKDDAARSKPHPDIFEATLERLRPIAREAVVVVGDSPYDAEAAVKAKLLPIGVLSGGFGEENLRRAGCREIYADPADLLARYEESLLGRPMELRPRPTVQ